MQDSRGGRRWKGLRQACLLVILNVALGSVLEFESWLGDLLTM